jgi:hypothetical protein
MAASPRDIVELGVLLYSNTFAFKVGLFTDWTLLPKKVACPHCHHPTTLRIPSSDSKSDSNRFTPCSNPDCTSPTPQRLFYKNGSIFNRSHLSLDTQVLLLFAFATQLNPATVLRVVGDYRCSNKAVQNFNRKIRRHMHAVTYYVDGYVREQIGGFKSKLALQAELAAAATAAEVSRLASYVVLPRLGELHARVPIEIDEGVCVCVCVCVCV